MYNDKDSEFKEASPSQTSGRSFKIFAVSGLTFALAAQLGFSFKGIFAKYLYARGVEPMTLLMMRMMMAYPFFIALFFILDGKNLFRVTKKQILLFLYVGVVGLGVTMIFSFYSYKYLDAGVASLIAFTYPAMTVAAIGFRDRTRLTRPVVISLALTLIGLILITPVTHAGIADAAAIGIFCALMTAFFYSTYVIIGSKLLREIPPLRASVYSMTALLLVFIPLFGVRSYPTDRESVTLIFLLATVSWTIPFLAYMYAMKHLGPEKAALASMAQPVFTTIIAYILLGERLGPVQLAGMLFILVGITALKTPASKPKAVTMPAEPLVETLNGDELPSTAPERQTAEG